MRFLFYYYSVLLRLINEIMDFPALSITNITISCTSVST